MSLYAQTVRVILDELNEALDSVDDGSTEEFLSMLENAEQVFFIGVGRVMLSLEAISKRLAHLGHSRARCRRNHLSLQLLSGICLW